MANKPVKIFEIKGNDWMRGLTRQLYSLIGGLFILTNHFDPFEKAGMCQPGFVNQALSSVSGATASFLTPFTLSGLGYFYAHAPTKLYKIDISTNVATDETSNVTTGACLGAAVWRDKYVYSLATAVRKIELGAGTDTSLLTGLTTGMPHVMATGADLGLNLYITNGNLIAKLILETGTTGNVLNAFSLETGQVSKDLTNDGRYLVILSDNNVNGSNLFGKSKCRVTFWDMVRTSADVIWNLDDTAVIGMKFIDGLVYVIGYENIYVCSAGMAPQVIYSFTGNATVTIRPASAAAITSRKGILYWIGTNGRVYAYGNPLDPNKKILYAPYFCESGTPTALVAATSKMFVATDTPGIVEVQGGTGVRNTSLIQTGPFDLGQRYAFAYVKMVLDTPIASGEAVILNSISTWDTNGGITTSATRDFTSDPNKATLLFYRTPAAASTDVPDFEKISIISFTLQKKALVRLELWGVPLEDQYQT